MSKNPLSSRKDRIAFLSTHFFVRRAGVTLIELLVVLVIIAIFLGLLLPAVYFARERARRPMCLSNLHQVAVAMDQFVELHKKVPDPAPTGEVGGWVLAILPLLEETQLADHLLASPSLAGSLSPLARRRPAVLTCPSAYEGTARFRRSRRAITCSMRIENIVIETARGNSVGFCGTRRRACANRGFPALNSSSPHRCLTIAPISTASTRPARTATRGRTFTGLPRRRGCRGPRPLVLHSRVHMHYNGLRGARALWCPRISEEATREQATAARLDARRRIRFAGPGNSQWCIGSDASGRRIG